ncbi:hypothetical protein VPH35_040639 [Triticum aestivum]
MSGSIRRILNLGLFEGVKRAYSLRRLNLELSKVKFFHPTAQEAAAHGKVLPTLTPAQFEATSRTRICNTDLATAEAAAPKIDPPKTELVIKPPEVSYSIRSPRCVHFLPTASESKSPGTPATSIPCQASTGTRRRRWPSPSLPRTYTSLTAKTQATSTSSIASSIPTRRTYARSSRPWCGGGSPRPSRLTGSGTATSSRCPRGSHTTGMPSSMVTPSSATPSASPSLAQRAMAPTASTWRLASGAKLATGSCPSMARQITSLSLDSGSASQTTSPALLTSLASSKGRSRRQRRCGSGCTMTCQRSGSQANCSSPGSSALVLASSWSWTSWMTCNSTRNRTRCMLTSNSPSSLVWK